MSDFSNEALITAHNVTKVVKQGKSKLAILQNISLKVVKHSCTAIVGASGSGKTTLLSLLAGLDDPTQGTIDCIGLTFPGASQKKRALLRQSKIGFVFQSFWLLPNLNVLENILLPIELAGTVSASDHLYAKTLLEQLSLSERASHYPRTLSGGEQQRVAVARALIHKPQILFADEPTGNLDTVTAKVMMDFIFDWSTRTGMTLVLVTHDHQLASHCDMVFKLHAGCLMDQPLETTLTIFPDAI